MCATLVSKVGLCSAVPVLVECWAVADVSSVVTGVPFLAGVKGRRTLPFPGINRLILQTLGAQVAAAYGEPD
jgi:hypothetical protein